MYLYERIAAALGWTLADVRSFSPLYLREIVRPVSAKLAQEITQFVSSGRNIIGEGYRKPSRPANVPAITRTGYPDPTSQELLAWFDEVGRGRPGGSI